MAIARVLEPEVMDSAEEAMAYDRMDFREVNAAFAARAIAIGPVHGRVLDAGTGTARIPIVLCEMLAAAGKHWEIVGIDLAESMLALGRQNVAAAGVADRVVLERVDAKAMPYRDRSFDAVISNSTIHHLPDPKPFLHEVARVLKPHGALLLRDLLRPPSEAAVDDLVNRYAGDCDDRQAQLFRDSLRAAFTLEEVRDLLSHAGIEGTRVYASSDRHWTAERPCYNNRSML